VLTFGRTSTGLMVPLGVDADGAILSNSRIAAGGLWYSTLGLSDGTQITGEMPGKVYDVPGVTQKFAGAAANNTTVTLYTVTAGKSLYINTLDVNVINQSGAIQAFYVQFLNTTPAIFHVLFYGAAIGQCHTFPFHPVIPMKLAAGYSIRVVSAAVGLYVNVALHGFEK
jgi:hypothetical protein